MIGVLCSEFVAKKYQAFRKLYSQWERTLIPFRVLFHTFKIILTIDSKRSGQFANKLATPLPSILNSKNYNFL